MFEGIRTSSITILVGSVIVFTLVAILGIWDVIDPEFTMKSLASLIVLAFISLLILVVTLERDRKWIFSPNHKGGSFSLMRVIGAVIVALIFIVFIAEWVF